MALQYFLPGDRGAWQATVQGLQRPTRRERLSTAHQTLNFSHLMGVKVSAEELKNVAVYCLGGDQDSAPRLHYCFLSVPPLSLHPLPSLLHICFKLQVGAKGRSHTLREAYFLSSKNWRTQRVLVPRSPTESCSVTGEQALPLNSDFIPLLTMIPAAPNAPPLLSLTPQQSTLCCALGVPRLYSVPGVTWGFLPCLHLVSSWLLTHRR